MDSNGDKKTCSVRRLHLTLCTTTLIFFISKVVLVIQPLAFRQAAASFCLSSNAATQSSKYIRRNHHGARSTLTFQKIGTTSLAFFASLHTTTSLTRDNKTPRLVVLHSLHSRSNNETPEISNSYTNDDCYKYDLYINKIDPNNNQDEDPFTKCWAATSSSVNPDNDLNIDEILQGLNSPAPQSFFVIQRALCIMAQLQTEQHKVFETCHYLLKRNHCFLYRAIQQQHQLPTLQDVNTRLYHRPGIDWTVMSKQKKQKHGNSSDSWQVIDPADNDDSKTGNSATSTSAIQQANHILNLVVEASDAQETVDQTAIDQLVENLELHLHITLGTDIRARRSADVVFSLALAGVLSTTTTTTTTHSVHNNNNNIYNVLVHISQLEMQRLSRRSSPRRDKNILHIAEKFAAAGCTGPAVQKLYRLAAESDILQPDDVSSHRGDGRNILVDNYDVAKILKASSSSSPASSSLESFNLLSERPMLWLWRFAARQTKAREKTISSDVSRKPLPPIYNSTTTNNTSFNTTTLTMNRNLLYSNQIITKFANPSKPLVVDIGCGLGTALLGLASLNSGKIFSDALPSSVHNTDWNWNECNYLGGDLSQLGIRFGNGIAMRWNLSHRLQFAYSSASHLLETVEASMSTYPGLTIAGILINFPSPYRLISKENSTTTGNSQLPFSPDDSFMVTRSVMERVAALLKSSGGGFLLLQSNCEDVAIELRDLAILCGLECVPAKHPVRNTVSASSAPNLRLTNRAVEWRERGGEPAVGPEWSSVPLLPKGCATETEVSCMFHNTPVHRCLLQWSKKV